LDYATLLAQAVLNGFVIGAMYMLMAVGFTLTFGIMRVINFAHGEFYMLGAFTAFFTYVYWEIPFVVCLLIAALTIGILGVLLERAIIQPFREDETSGMIATLAISVIIQNGLLQTFGAYTHRLQLGAIETASIQLPGGISIGVYPLMVFMVAVLALGSLQLLFYGHNDAFGDSLLKLPALRAARTAFPEGRLVYASAGNSQLSTTLSAETAPLIDAFHSRTRLRALARDLATEGRPVADHAVAAGLTRTAARRWC